MIRLVNGATIHCDIRDYCPTGLYLAFVEEPPTDGSVEALIGQRIQVELRVGGSRGAASFQLTGRAIHACPAGVGAYFANMPEGALNALRNARVGPGPEKNGRVHSDLPKEQAQALRRECASLLRPFLDAVTEDFFARAAERLGAAIDHGLSLPEQSAYIGGAQVLVQSRDRITERFFEAIRNRIRDLDPLRSGMETVPGSDTFVLVEKAEFEDWLSLSAEINRIEADIAPQIDQFERRYSRLVDSPIDRKNNPFGPELMFRAFQGSIEGLSFDPSVRTVLYKAIGQAIGLHAPEFYDQLNDTLAPLEATKSRRIGVEGSPPSSSAADAVPVDDSPPPEDDTTGWAPLETAGAAAGPPLDPGTGGGQGHGHWDLESSVAPVSTSVEPYRRYAADPASGAAPRTSDRHGIAYPRRPMVDSSPNLLRLVAQLQQVSEQLLNPATLAGHRTADGHATSQQALPEASLHELFVALDSLPPAVQSGPAGLTGPALTEAVAARIAADSGGAKRISPAAKQVLESVIGLLGQAKVDYLPASDVGSLVRRLERPLLKLALKDERFPGLPDHPARQVLNLIDQYAVAADDKGRFFDQKLREYLRKLVDIVSVRAEEDPAIFKAARNKLRKKLPPILQVRRTRVARMQQSCEGRQRIRTDRARVNDALERRLGGREVPRIVLQLLDAGWRQHLLLLAVRDGARGEEWDAALAVLDGLCALLFGQAQAPSSSGEDPTHLMDEIQRGLAVVSVDGHLLTAFMDELGELLASIATRGGPTRDTVAVPRGQSAVALAGGDEAPAVNGTLAEQLQLGDWWDFDLEGISVPMQLVWLSQPPFYCAFANRSATNKLDLNLAQLADRIEGGLAKPGKDLDLPLLERSEVSLFDETYQQLMRQAMHDPITDLPNRKGFLHRLAALAQPSEGDEVHSVCIIEFGHFRTIYDTCGVEAAEELSRRLAGAVRDHVGADGILSAFRYDTLALLVPASRSSDCSPAADLLDKFKDYRFRHEQHSYRIGVNVGIAEYAPPGVTAEEAVRRADSACIAAKSLGGNRIQVYEQASPELKSQESLMEWAGRIDSYLDGDGLYLRCQKVAPIDSDSSLLPYYEILLGIRGPTGKDISPIDFIPAVERLNRSHELDMWVIRSVFDWIRSNPSAISSLGGFAINLCATSMDHPDVKDCIQRAIGSLGDIPAHKIIFEITESAAIESYSQAQDFIRDIRRHGCKFSLDDFGTGFTSYAHLKNLLADTLKIDGSFVKDMVENMGDCAMVKSMNDIAHSLGLRTVAEYAASAAIVGKLQEIGVDYAQGYAIHKPCPIDHILSEGPAS